MSRIRAGIEHKSQKSIRSAAVCLDYHVLFNNRICLTRNNKPKIMIQQREGGRHLKSEQNKEN